MSQSKLQPALFGGLVAGVLSALPFVSAGNCCCCLWVISGGLLAAYLLQSGQPHPIDVTDGAIVGLLAGVIGALVTTVLSIPLAVMFAPIQAGLLERFMDRVPEVSDGVREALRSIEDVRGPFSVIVGLLANLFSGVIFGTIGGLLGAVLFRRKAPTAAAGAPPAL